MIGVADIDLIERAGFAAYRHHDNDLAVELHALALRLRSETGHHLAFLCEPDESAGLAEIIDLHDLHSRKV